MNKKYLGNILIYCLMTTCLIVTSELSSNIFLDETPKESNPTYISFSQLRNHPNATEVTNIILYNDANQNGVELDGNEQPFLYVKMKEPFFIRNVTVIYLIGNETFTTALYKTGNSTMEFDNITIRFETWGSALQGNLYAPANTSIWWKGQIMDSEGYITDFWNSSGWPFSYSYGNPILPPPPTTNSTSTLSTNSTTQSTTNSTTSTNNTTSTSITTTTNTTSITTILANSTTPNQFTTTSINSTNQSNNLTNSTTNSSISNTSSPPSSNDDISAIDEELINENNEINGYQYGIIVLIIGITVIIQIKTRKYS